MYKLALVAVYRYRLAVARGEDSFALARAVESVTKTQPQYEAVYTIAKTMV